MGLGAGRVCRTQCLFGYRIRKDLLFNVVSVVLEEKTMDFSLTQVLTDRDRWRDGNESSPATETTSTHFKGPVGPTESRSEP